MEIKNVSIIPARGGSKGIPKKNIYSLNGLPLIAYTIKASLESGCIDKTIVSTDDKEIAEVSKKYGAEVINRPVELARDESQTEPVITHSIETIEADGIKPENIFLLQPTSPLRTASDIKAAYNKFLADQTDSLLSTGESHLFLWKEKNNIAYPVNYDFNARPRRQDLSQYRENGAIYIFNRDGFMEHRNRLFGKISMYPMNPEFSVEIDDYLDIEIIKGVMAKHSNLFKNDFNDLLSRIKLVATDVDGVLTDGGMYYGNEGEVMKLFNTLDGMGLERIRKIGVKNAIITKENSKIAQERAKKLGIKDIFIGVNDKLAKVREIIDGSGIKFDEVCFIGDDINDLDVLQEVGFPVAVSNAVPEVKKAAKYITTRSGGNGAVREVCDLIYNAMSS